MDAFKEHQDNLIGNLVEIVQECVTASVIHVEHVVTQAMEEKMEEKLLQLRNDMNEDFEKLLKLYLNE